MTDQQIKELFSTEILPDTPEGIVLRNILFNTENSINWQGALDLIKRHLPEIKIES